MVREQVANDIIEALRGKSADEVLTWFGTNLPERTVQFTSFGPTGMVILDKMNALGLIGRIPIVTIDTLHLFPETADFIRLVAGKYSNMSLHTYRPEGLAEGEREEFRSKYGNDLWVKDYEQYAFLTKLEPTERALREMSVHAWITGRRRSQGAERSRLEVVEWSEGRLKVNPLADWTQKEVWDYIHAHHVPYNPLHDKGYPSIGDIGTTRAVAEGEGERAGRFKQLNRTECGMHEHLAKVKEMKERARKKAQEEEEGAPHLECGPCEEVQTRTFQKLVLETPQDMLIEFYSPYCGHCQVFAPKFERVAKKLRKAAPQLRVARMDVIENEVPTAGQEAGFDVDSYPTLYLAQVAAADTVAGSGPPKLKLVKYSGYHEEGLVLQWIKKELPYLSALL